MTHHKVAPHDFLDFVHDVDRTVLDADPLLVAAIAGLPGRKFIFTNGDAPYAMRVLDRLGLGQSFEAIHDIHACGHAPKPTPSAYHGMIDSFGKIGRASCRARVCQYESISVVAVSLKKKL